MEELMRVDILLSCQDLVALDEKAKSKALF